MTAILLIDWNTIFIPKEPAWDSLLEMVIRGTITYWFVLLYMRFLRRGTGQLTLTDIILITMIADAAQNSMAANYESVTEGAVLVGTLVFWDFLLDWLGFRSVLFYRLVSGEPKLLIKDGKILNNNLKATFISEEELLGIIREKGVDEVKKVKVCYLESSGNISVVETDS